MKTSQKTPLWRDSRFWWIAAQGIAVLLTAIAVLFFWTQLSQNLVRLGIRLGFDFLQSQAAFDIGETPISYQPADNYARALLVGLVNSLRVMIAGIIFATLVGVTVGLARLSDNWLVRKLALVYVELLRNTPLLLQLLFWYFAVFLGLPKLPAYLQLPGPIYLTQQGIALPWLQFTPDTGFWLVCLGGSLGIAALWQAWDHRRGASLIPKGLKFLGLLTTAIAIALATARNQFLVLDLPQLVDNSSLQGGLRLSPEFAALLLGLTFYTATFIAEIVRGGVQSVPRGQWEAAKALGLNGGATLRWVIVPQALRAIVPSLGNQCLNLAKNSSLAIAVGYPDLYAVASTTFNQTGRAVEVMVLIMVTYLSISLVISALINLYNRSVQLVER